MIIVYAYGEKYKDPVLAITSPSLHNALKWRILALCLVSVDWTEKVQKPPRQRFNAWKYAHS